MVKAATAHCECSGEVLEDALKIPADGGIGLEADRKLISIPCQPRKGGQLGRRRFVDLASDF